MRGELSLGELSFGDMSGYQTTGTVMVCKRYSHVGKWEEHAGSSAFGLISDKQ